jgi:hypothetical protein
VISAKWAWAILIVARVKRRESARGPTTAARFGARGLSGFVFQNPHLIAYHACPERTFFFTVEGITLS